MRHSKSQLRSQLIRSSSTCRLLQRSHVRHRTPQIFRSQFETKVHNRIRKRVENYVENRSSHVRNPVFYEQICDELLSGFYHDSTFRPSRTERIVRARGHPRGRRKTLDCRYQTSLATPNGVISGSKEPHNTPTDASNNHIWATTPGS